MHSAHHSTSPVTDHDDPSASATYYVGIVGVILFLAIVVFTIWLFNSSMQVQSERKLYGVRPQELGDLQVRQLAAISESRWVDEPAGRVAIPIDQAIPLFVAAHSTGRWPEAPKSPPAAPTVPQEAPAAP